MCWLFLKLIIMNFIYGLITGFVICLIAGVPIVSWIKTKAKLIEEKAIRLEKELEKHIKK